MGKKRFGGRRGHFASSCKEILPHMKSGCLQLNPWDARAGNASKAELRADIAKAQKR